MTYVKKILVGIVNLTIAFCGLLWANGSASAMSMTPMRQSISLTPGDTYTGRVTIYQTGQGDDQLHYQASIAPLTVNDADNEYYGVFSQESDYTDIVEWVTLSNGEESVNYGSAIDGYAGLDEKIDLKYTINVPKDAKGGGHYFAVLVSSIPAEGDGNVTIKDSISIASVIYAEVAGDITVSGTIKDNSVTGFLFNPPIKTSFMVENNGNTHAEITYYLQVFPFFSGEEIYTTEENPSVDYVLPGTSRYIEQIWNDTPAMGIFRVRQVAYYDSMDNEPSITEKTVIICPLWLLFVIILVIILLIIWIIIRSKSHKKSRKGAE